MGGHVSPPPASRQVVGWWLATAAYAALLFVASVIPVGPGPSIRHLDKAAHLGEYLLFAWLLAQAVRAARMRDRVVSLWAWIAATSYGGLLEGVQAMLPWRSAELADAVANAVGAALGVWLASKSIVHSR